MVGFITLTQWIVATILALSAFRVTQSQRVSGGWNAIPDEEGPPVYVQAFFQEANFFEAQANCWRQGAHLASFDSVTMFEQLRELANGVDAWLGLYHLGEKLPSLPNYRLYFTDGSLYPFPSGQEHESLWGRFGVEAHHALRKTQIARAYEYDPNNIPPGENCAFIQFHSPFYVNGVRLNDESCLNKKPAHICRKVDRRVIGLDDTLSFSGPSKPSFTTAEEFYRLRDSVAGTSRWKG